MRTREEIIMKHRHHTPDYLRKLGVEPLPPRCGITDTGADPDSVESHLNQSSHLISAYYIAAGTWLLSNEDATRQKIEATKEHGIPAIAGYGAFEIAAAQGELPTYLDLCAHFGFVGIECSLEPGERDMKPGAILAMARSRDLSVQFHVKVRSLETDNAAVTELLLDRAASWLDAGATKLVVDAVARTATHELFNAEGMILSDYMERFTDTFGLQTVVFDAPQTAIQFSLLERFGHNVHLCGIHLEQLLPVEIYRRGLTVDAYANEKLHPHPLH